MRRLIITLPLIWLLAATIAFTSTQPNPAADCPPGLVCFLPEEVVNLRLKIIHLKEQVALLKAKKLRRLGHNVGCGAGVTLDSEVGAGLYCGYMFGWRF